MTELTDTANNMYLVVSVFLLSFIDQKVIFFLFQSDIYFFTIRTIPKDEELLVWYCKEFAERLNYPLTGELMLQQMRRKRFFNISVTENNFRGAYDAIVTLRLFALCKIFT